MTGDYPKFEKRGNKNMLIFKAPKFMSSIVFDPVTTLGDELSDDDEDDKDVASAIKLNVCMFIAMLAAFFMLMWRFLLLLFWSDL